MSAAGSLVSFVLFEDVCKTKGKAGGGQAKKKNRFADSISSSSKGQNVNEDRDYL